MTKAALEALAKTYANETSDSAIKVNLIDPGATATRMRAEAYPGEDQSKLPDAGGGRRGLHSPRHARFHRDRADRGAVGPYPTLMLRTVEGRLEAFKARFETGLQPPRGEGVRTPYPSSVSTMPS